MSASASPSSSASPSLPPAEAIKQKAWERVLESVAPSLGLSRLIGLNHMNSILGDARRRTRDSHGRQMQTLDEIAGRAASGAALPLTQGDDVINVAGDTYHIAQTPRGSGAAKWAALALAGVGLPLAGALALSLYQSKTQPAESPTTIVEGDQLPYDFGIR